MTKLNLLIGNYSHAGKTRKVNEDFAGSVEGKFGKLFIVCDGMGGHNGGFQASHIAVETISSHFTVLDNRYDPIEELTKAFEKANSEIIFQSKIDPELKGMGTTAVVLLIINDNAFYAHTGDSRIYLIRHNKIHKLTKDHSLVQELVDSKTITRYEADKHPQKNIITRALGLSNKLKAELAKEPLVLYTDDILIECTDGLTDYLEDKEIFKIASSNRPQEAADKLMDSVLKHEARDNITVQIIMVTE